MTHFLSVKMMLKMDEEGHALLKMKRGWIAAVTLCFVIWMGTLLGGFGEKQAAKGADRYDHVVQFPKERYPETGSHIQEAIRKGHSDVCTIDRNGADARRQESLKEFRQNLALTGMNGQWRFVLREEKAQAYNMLVHLIIGEQAHGSGTKSAGFLMGKEYYSL